MLTRCFWKSYFTVYDRLSQVIPYRRLLVDSVSRLKVNPGGHYLDIGCGTGNSSLAIYNRARGNCTVVGLDYIPSAIERAKSKLPAEGLSNVGFSHADINKGLHFPAESFDGVLANNVIYLVSDPVETLAQVLAVLKPGGRFVMTNPRKGGNPFEIYLSHLREKKASYNCFPSLQIVPHAALKFLDFIAFLPFQLVLQSGKGVESRFWDAEDWEQVFSQLRNRTLIPFEVSPPSLAYADQNYTFTLTRLPQ